MICGQKTARNSTPILYQGERCDECTDGSTAAAIKCEGFFTSQLPHGIIRHNGILLFTIEHHPYCREGVKIEAVEREARYSRTGGNPAPNAAAADA